MTVKKLPIDYNTSLPIGAYHEDPLSFLVYDRFFDNFTLVLSENDGAALRDGLGFQGDIIRLGIPKSSGKFDAQLKSKKFVELVKREPKRKYVLYSPLDPPYKVNPLTYLMNSPTIAHAYENKRYFRDEFADLIRMPKYVIKHVDELDKAASYKELKEEFGSALVLQDEESSGSKGTYIVKDADDYVDAVNSLKKFSYGRSIVVSQYIEGQTSSIQVCITKYGIFSGGVQRQLVDSKYLCNPKLEGTTKWCGGEVGVEYPDIVQHQAQEIATIVGSELASHGYKGIFGVDLMVTPQNEVYAIEINARLTGYSHIISDMQLREGKIPFMLLHALELSNAKYEVTDLNALPSGARYKKPVSYLIITNPTEESFEIKEDIKLGIYKVVNEKLEYVKPGNSVSDLKNEDMFILSGKSHGGEIVASGKRLLRVTKLGKSLSKGDLNQKSIKLVSIIKDHFGLPS